MDHSSPPDEIDFPAFRRDPASLDSYLTQCAGPNGLRFVTYPKLAALQRTWESYWRELSALGCRIEPDDTVVDIGAHHGIVSLNCARLGARVLALEPNPINFEVLRRNIALNPSYRIEARPLAVCGQAGKVIFNFGKTSTTGALTAAERDWKRTEYDHEVEGVTLSAALDSVGRGEIKLLKMDCEGAEHDILAREGADVLRRARFACVEAHPTRGHAADEVVSRLEKDGFKVKRTEGAHGCLELFAERR